MFHFWSAIPGGIPGIGHSGKIVFSTGCGGEMRELPKFIF